ncbi:MAG: hypothetical protein ACRDCW_02400 [Sarcina sp.]
MNLCFIGIHSNQWIGVCKLYYCFNSYHMYEVYQCVKCKRIKTRRVTEDSMCGSDCSDVPTLQELLKRIK